MTAHTAARQDPRRYRFPPLVRVGLFGSMPASQVITLGIGGGLSFAGVVARLFPYALAPIAIAAVIASTTATELTELQHTLTAGTYYLHAPLIVQSSATGTGLKFGVNYTGTVTRMACTLRYPSTGTTASTGVADDVAAVLTGSLWEAMAATTETTSAPNLGPYTGVAVANTNILNVIECLIVVSDSGDLEIWHGSEGAVSTSVEVGSASRVTKLAD